MEELKVFKLLKEELLKDSSIRTVFEKYNHVDDGYYLFYVYVYNTYHLHDYTFYTKEDIKLIKRKNFLNGMVK
jgi:hypothetical protein